MQTLMTTLVVAASMTALPALAQASGSGSTPREMQRGVPGTDVDVNMNANGRARNNGVPGVDVDVRNRATGTNRGAAGSADTRASGAGPASTGGAGGGDTTAQRAARVDRN